MNEGSYKIPMLEKGFEVIEFIAKNPRGVAMKSLVDNLDISKTTIFRLLISLCEMGYIFKNEETAEYFLSKKMLKVGLSAIGEPNLVEQAMPLMRSLRDEIGEIVMLGVLMNNRAVLLEQIPGSYSFTFLTRPGTQFTTHTSVPGKVFAAFSGDYEREKIIDAIDFVKFNENTIATKDDFLAELSKVREQGFAVELEEEVKGVNCLGVPIYNQFGNITSALWTSGPSGRLTAARIAEIKDLVMQTADKISSTLGYRKSVNTNIL